MGAPRDVYMINYYPAAGGGYLMWSSYDGRQYSERKPARGSGWPRPGKRSSTKSRASGACQQLSLPEPAPWVLYDLPPSSGAIPQGQAFGPYTTSGQPKPVVAHNQAAAGAPG
jgi:hypothetical protein